MFFWIIILEIFEGNELIFCEEFVMGFFEIVWNDVCVLSWVVLKFNVVIVGWGFCCFCGEVMGEGLLFVEDFVFGELWYCLWCWGEFVGDIIVDCFWGDLCWMFWFIVSSFFCWCFYGIVGVLLVNDWFFKFLFGCNGVVLVVGDLNVFFNCEFIKV